jgi:hypothetical protein
VHYSDSEQHIRFMRLDVASHDSVRHLSYHLIMDYKDISYSFPKYSSKQTKSNIIIVINTGYSKTAGVIKLKKW